MAKIGLLGGSFNPAHAGHRFISLQAMQALELDEIWWLVSPQNPLKSTHDMAPIAVRLRSATVCARRSRIRPMALESKLGTRYTINTLRKLQMLMPQHRFLWLMGADNLHSFHRWKAWRGIAHSLPIAIIGRPRYNHRTYSAPAWSWLRHFVHKPSRAKHWPLWHTPALVRLNFMPHTQSSTRLRLAHANSLS
jgi:nicotinate-nucleotide adenylyltransferase